MYAKHAELLSFWVAVREQSCHNYLSKASLFSEKKVPNPQRRKCPTPHFAGCIANSLPFAPMGHLHSIVLIAM